MLTGPTGLCSSYGGLSPANTKSLDVNTQGIPCWLHSEATAIDACTLFRYDSAGFCWHRLGSGYAAQWITASGRMSRNTMESGSWSAQSTRRVFTLSIATGCELNVPNTSH